jgi:uncharacterized protein YbjT (DUF2867 family)
VGISGKNQDVRLSTHKKHRLVLTGASGNVGSRVAKLVIPSHKGAVILTSRDRTTFRERLKQGAEIRFGSMEDSHFLSDLFRNAEAALIMVPFPRHITEFNAFQRRVVESLFDSIKGSSLKYIIHLSCLGAHRPDKTGPILGNYDLERRLNWLKDIHIVHLRPSFFMEGFFDFLSIEREKGIISSPLSPHTPLPLISAENVAQAAAGFLFKLSFRGQSIHQLPGPPALSMDRIVNIIGDVINHRKLKYEQIDYEKARDGLIGKGYSEEWIESWMSCFKYMNEEKNLFGHFEEEAFNYITFKELASCMKFDELFSNL